MPLPYFHEGLRIEVIVGCLSIYHFGLMAQQNRIEIAPCSQFKFWLWGLYGGRFRDEVKSKSGHLYHLTNFGLYSASFPKSIKSWEHKIISIENFYAIKQVDKFNYLWTLYRVLQGEGIEFRYKMPQLKNPQFSKKKSQFPCWAGRYIHFASRQ